MPQINKIVDSHFSLNDLVQQEIVACQNDLNRFQQITANTYEGIAENLPVIISKIENTNNDARALIQYFISGDSYSSESQNYDEATESIVASTVREAKQNMVTVSQKIREMFKIDQQIFHHIQKQVNQIDELRNSIMEITKISDDIELLSYNSVFVASKAGLSGAAFSYIAKEIKVLSNQTKSYARKMREGSDHLVANFDKFNDEINSLNEKTSTRLNNIDSELDTIFNRYNTGLNNIANLIYQTLDRSDKAKNHIPAIMVSLQPQDLVRQLLEQINSINNDFLSFTSNKTSNIIDFGTDEVPESVEEKTARILVGSELCKQFIGKVTKTMTSSVADLEGLLNKLFYELQDIENDRVSMVDFFSNPQDFLQGKSSIEQISEDSVRVIKDIYDFIENSIIKKKQVAKLGKLLENELKSIETLFQGMRHIVRQFTTIKVVSRIEISREDTLSRNMTDSSEMFDKLTENIDKHILLLREHLEKINTDIISNLELLNQNITNQENSIHDIEKKVNISVDKLQTIRFNINDAVRSVGKDSNELFGLINRSMEGVKGIRRIIATSDKINRHFDKISDNANHTYQLGRKILPNIFYGETDLVRFSDLQEISQKFSIKSDNTENIYGTEETNELSGDLVLF